MENHCVSLEIAKQLKEAEYPQKGHFWWQKGTYIGNDKRSEECFIASTKEVAGDKEGNFWVAPLATEILEELPDKCPIHEGELLICPAFTNGDFFVGYGEHINLQGCHIESGNLPNALAKMWLYLKKGKK